MNASTLRFSVLDDEILDARDSVAADWFFRTDSVTVVDSVDDESTDVEDEADNSFLIMTDFEGLLAADAVAFVDRLELERINSNIDWIVDDDESDDGVDEMEVSESEWMIVVITDNIETIVMMMLIMIDDDANDE